MSDGHSRPLHSFHIAATGHSVNYLPEYVAARHGWFAAEGLHVTAAVSTPWEGVLPEIDAGRAQAALGGIWVPAMFHNRGAHYTAFAQASLRAPLALMARTPDPAFRWSRLEGRVVAVMGASGAGAGLALKMLLRENGIDLAAVRFIGDLDGPLLATLFRGGLADYLLIDAPTALALRAEGAALVADLAACGGNLPWSVYYAPAHAPGAEARAAFCRALARGMEFVNATPAATYGGVLGSLFPAIDPAILLRLVDTFRANGMWTTPRPDRAAHDRWQAGIAAGHLVEAPVPYDALIDSRATG